ncbi:hypothetical protein CPB83DRAFT_851647 [Crepidotus variabilis]|uniref:DUF6534 domain-containing protein n=1 Tax=Crepidotus variabilis TaxID=179855 RepID=A0A9P6EIR7_9AGAR|nr:hypothetical protein CPB83DRAFT_851647 [Crepidotus variabilis]
MAVEDPHYPVKLPVTFAGVYGAIMVATMINLCLYGVGLLMVLQYFRQHSKNDPILPKITIVVLIILATLQTIFASHQVYDTFVTKGGQMVLLDEIMFSVPGAWMCGYLAAFFAEGYFCTRIWIAGERMNSRARYAVIPVTLLAFIHISAGLAQVIVMGTSHTYSKMTMRTNLLLETTAVQGAGAALADIIISATLCYIFHTNRSGLGRTNSMINKLITYAIIRAIATSFSAVMAVILYYFCSGTYYFMIPLFACTHLYLISAVSMLTSREGIREQGDPSFHVSNLEMSTTKGSIIINGSEMSSHTTSG